MASLASFSDDGPDDQRERYDQTQKPWVFPSTYDQPPEGYPVSQQYSSAMPWYPRRTPQDYQSTPGLVPANFLKNRDIGYDAPPAPANHWGPRDDYWSSHLKGMAANAPLPRTDPLKKPFDENDEQLNRHIRQMRGRIDRLMAKHEAESELSLQITLSEIERITDQTIDHAIRRGAVIDDHTFERLASRLRGEPAPPVQAKGESAKAQDHRLRRRAERLGAEGKNAPRPHVWWKDDPNQRPTHSESKNMEMSGAVPVMPQRTPGISSRQSNHAQRDASNNPTSQYKTGVPRQLFGNNRNLPPSQGLPMKSAPEKAPTPPPPVRTYKQTRAETGKTRELRTQVPSQSQTKLSEPLRASWTHPHPHVKDQDVPTHTKSPEKSENGPESKDTHTHHQDPLLEEVGSELRDQGQWSSENTPKPDSQDPDTSGHDVLQGKASLEQGKFRAPYVSDDHDEATDSVEEDPGSRRLISLGFADNEDSASISLKQATNSSIDDLTLPPEMSRFLVQSSSPPTPEIAHITPTLEGSALYNAQDRNRSSVESVKKQSYFPDKPTLPRTKAIREKESEKRHHSPGSRYFKQKMYDAVFDALCDARHVFQTPTMPGATAIIPTMTMMPQFVMPPVQLPKRRSGFGHAYESSDDESETNTTSMPHYTRRYRRRRERSRPSAASDMPRVFRPSNTNHAPDDLQGSTHHQEFQIQSPSPLPQAREYGLPFHVTRDSFSLHDQTPAHSPARINNEHRCEKRCSALVSAEEQEFNNEQERVLSGDLESGDGEDYDSDSDQSFQTASTGGSRRGSMSRDGKGVMKSPRTAIHVSQSLAEKTGDLVRESISGTSLGHDQQYLEPFHVNTSPFTEGPPSVPTPPSLSEEDDDSHHSPTRGNRIGEPAMLTIQATSPSYYLVPLSDETHHLAVAVQAQGGANLSKGPSEYLRTRKAQPGSNISIPVSTSRIRQQRHQKYRDEETESSTTSYESF